MKIVTDTITAGDTTAIPTRLVPNTTINVKSGRYKEVLPIIVPAETVILGDEVRSTNVAAASASDRSVDISDSYYTVDTFKLKN
jgi:pectin methylesterase-like acyl-CoA thioesterase